jgi:hypothetical protein
MTAKAGGSPRGKAGGKPARRGGMIAVAKPLDAVTRPLLTGRSRVESTILLEWGRIVDAETAANARPERLRFSGPKDPAGPRGGGTLHLLVAPAFAPELQHRTRQVVERINGHLGWAAVGRLALRQGPIPRSAPPPRRAPRPLAPAEEAEIDAAVDGIADERLRGALARLARAVKAKTPPGET